MGPLFAAVTGVAFKEGVCYGKPECVVLFFLTPALLLGAPAHTLAQLCGMSTASPLGAGENIGGLCQGVLHRLYRPVSCSSKLE